MKVWVACHRPPPTLPTPTVKYIWNPGTNIILWNIKLTVLFQHLLFFLISKCFLSCPSWWRYWQRRHQERLLVSSLFWKEIIPVCQSVRSLRNSYLQPVVFSPPKVWGKEGIISVEKTEILSQLLHWLELSNINKTVGRSQEWHIGSIINYRNHIVRQYIVKLLRHIILSKEN